MKFLLNVSILVFLFIGCGGGGGSDSSEEKEVVSENIYDTYFTQQWYLAKDSAYYKENGILSDAHLHAGDYYDKYRGKGITVAVIDAGLDIEQEDLAGAIKDTYDINTDTDDVSTDDYHGTAVTGLVGARANRMGIFGVASSSDIVFIKYTKYMSDSQTIKLFQKAVEFGADIINCSWGTDNVSDSVKEYIQSIAKTGRNGKGVIVVFASGNRGSYMGNDESSIPEVLSVGATNKENIRTYSNYGPNLDVVAPGGDVDFGMITLDYSGSVGHSSGDYTYMSGTSAAAPLVSGVVAMMLEANPNLTSSQVQEILKNTADKVGGVTYEDGFNFFYGYGKVNVKKAIEASLATP